MKKPILAAESGETRVRVSFTEGTLTSGFEELVDDALGVVIDWGFAWGLEVDLTPEDPLSRGFTEAVLLGFGELDVALPFVAPVFAGVDFPFTTEPLLITRAI
jgi:hypothetical protein